MGKLGDDEDSAVTNLDEDSSEARRAILELVPEARRNIVELERESTPGDLLVYSYVSVILMWEILAPALDGGNVDLARRGFEVVERLISSDRAEVQNAVLIRIPDKVLEPRWRPLVRRLAGPRLREALAQYTGDGSWL